MNGNVETVSEVIHWYEAHEVREFSPIALAERRRVWSLFSEAFGEKRLEECRPADLLEFICGQRGARSNWTRRRIKATVCKPFNVASEVGLIAKNPFAGLRIPLGTSGRDWTEEEYRAILRNSPPHFRRLIVFLRFSGARPGEARALKWPEIRDEVEAIIQRRHKTSWATDEPRRIYFNHVVLRLLLWLRRHKAHQTHVFANAIGNPWTIQALAKHLAAVRLRAGLPDDVKCHGGRHTFATGAIMAGVDLATLAELLGHRSVKTTERYVTLVNKRAYLNAASERAIGNGRRSGGTSPRS